jgi:hypothetical protein
VHQREQLATLADESEPLGPWRDESGRRCVHRSVAEPLELPECFAGSGASGSTFAIRTGFVTGFVVAMIGLSTDFLGADLAVAGFAAGCMSDGLFALASALSAGFVFAWAAARPGFATDLSFAGLAAVAGLSVVLEAVGGNTAAVRARSSRVSVFKLASWSKALGELAA